MSGDGGEHAGQRGAARLAAGQRCGVFRAGQAELFEQVQRAVVTSAASGPSPASA